MEDLYLTNNNYKIEIMEDAVVSITDNENNDYVLRFSQSFLLLQRDNTVKIKFPYITGNYVFLIFNFVHAQSPFNIYSGTAQQNTDFRANEIETTLTNWYHDQWMASPEPIQFTVDKKQYKVQYRTEASAFGDYRKFSVTIWLKLQ